MDLEEKTHEKEGTHLMTLYQKLKASGNPQAIAQVVISLLESNSVKDTAKKFF